MKKRASFGLLGTLAALSGCVSGELVPPQRQCDADTPANGARQCVTTGTNQGDGGGGSTGGTNTGGGGVTTGGNNTGGGGVPLPTNNVAPTPSQTPLVNMSVDAGSDIVPINLTHAYFQDDDGDELTFNVTGLEGSGLTYNSSNQRISGAIPMEGRVSVTVTASDGIDSVTRNFFITAEARQEYIAVRPTITSDIIFEQRVESGQPIAGIDVASGFHIPATDYYFDPYFTEQVLTYEVAFSHPDSGLHFDRETNTIIGDFSGSDDVIAIVTVTANRIHGMAEEARSVEHRIRIFANQDPVFSNRWLEGLRSTQGEPLTTSIDLGEGFDDPDGNNSLMTFAAWVDEGGGMLNDLSYFGLVLEGSVISGTPSLPGDFLIRVSATDEEGGTSTGFIRLSVEQGNQNPSASAAAPDSVILTSGSSANLPIDLDGWFEDGDFDDLTYTASVDGVNLADAGIGLWVRGSHIDGIFTGTGNTQVAVTANDLRGGIATHTFTIEAAVNDPMGGGPAGNRGIPDQILTVGEAWNFEIPNEAFQGLGSDSQSYSVEIVNSDNSTVAIGGAATGEVPFALNNGSLASTADASHAGNGWTIRVTADDGAAAAVAEFDVGLPFQTGARTALPHWLGGAREYGIGFDENNIFNPINGVHSLTDSDDDSGQRQGESNWNGAGRYGSGVYLTWSFADAGAVLKVRSHFDNQFATLQFTPQQKDAIREIFSHVGAVSGITFDEVLDRGLSGSGDIRVVLGTQSQLGSQDNVAGFAYHPSGHNPKGSTFTAQTSYIGDIHIVSDRLPDHPFEEPYSNEHRIVAHELLHAIGLDHPFNGDAGDEAGRSGYYEGETLLNSHGEFTGGAHQTPLTDTYMETIMTYNNTYSGNQVPWRPGIYDIAALQHLYGANTNHRSDDTYYRYDSDTLVFDTIWDGGGNDTIIHSGYRNAIIDLTPGNFSSVGSSSDNLGIAHGVVIENAVGGEGNDRIIGNSANNVLTGGGGADTFVIAMDPIAGSDRITDFRVGEDRIEFVGITANDLWSARVVFGDAIGDLFADSYGYDYVFTAFGMELTLNGVDIELTEGADYYFSNPVEETEGPGSYFSTAPSPGNSEGEVGESMIVYSDSPTLTSGHISEFKFREDEIEIDEITGGNSVYFDFDDEFFIVDESEMNIYFPVASEYLIGDCRYDII